MKHLSFTAAVAASVVSALLVVACKGSQASPDRAESPHVSPSAGQIAPTGVGTNPGNAGKGTPLAAAPGHELAAFAMGCFWGSENTFRHVRGVTATAVGYAGGHTEAPTYEDVCGHGTGHAEVVLVEFDPKVVSYDKLLETFWKNHDPTTKNRQGNDRGLSYRSAIYYLGVEQKHVAEETIADVDASGLWNGKVVTEVEPAGDFWEAEPEHQDYLEKRPGGYTCHFPRADWILPKRKNPDAI